MKHMIFNLGTYALTSLEYIQAGPRFNDPDVSNVGSHWATNISNEALSSTVSPTNEPSRATD